MEKNSYIIITVLLAILMIIGVFAINYVNEENGKNNNNEEPVVKVRYILEFPTTQNDLYLFVPIVIESDGDLSSINDNLSVNNNGTFSITQTSKGQAINVSGTGIVILTGNHIIGEKFNPDELYLNLLDETVVNFEWSDGNRYNYSIFNSGTNSVKITINYDIYGSFYHYGIVINDFATYKGWQSVNGIIYAEMD